MELKLVILSLACLSCLVPPSLGTSLLAAKAAAVGVKGAAVFSAGALAAKGLALKGAVVVGAKALALKALAAKAAAMAAAKPQLQVQVQPVPQSTVVLSPPSLSAIKDRVVNLVSTIQAAALNKKAAVSELLLSLLPTKTVVQPPQVVEVVDVPKVLVKNVANPCPPSVAIIGPTMHVA